MKKYFYLMALVAISGLTFTACENDDDNSVSVSLKEPATKELAAKYTIETPSNGYIKEVDGVQYALSEFEITEDNGMLIKYEEVGSRATDALGGAFWSWHKFTQNGDDKFFVIGFGDIIVETASGRRSHITLIPEGVDPIDVYASLMMPNNGGELAGYLCRTWNISQARIIINDYSETNSKGERKARQFASNWIKTTNGTVNLMDLIDYANKEHDAGINTDLGERNTVESLFFSGSGTFTINYVGTKLRDVGAWSWINQDNKAKSAYFSYVWYNEEMGNDLLGGAASIKFNGNEADLHLFGKDRSGVGSGTGHNSEYTGSDFEVQFKMYPANND